MWAKAASLTHWDATSIATGSNNGAGTNNTDQTAERRPSVGTLHVLGVKKQSAVEKRQSNESRRRIGRTRPNRPSQKWLWQPSSAATWGRARGCAHGVGRAGASE